VKRDLRDVPLAIKKGVRDQTVLERHAEMVKMSRFEGMFVNRTIMEKCAQA
jgi:hypothetical protein